MRPLLWKEMRGLRPWILGAGALVLVVELLCFSPNFEKVFLGQYVGFLPLAPFAAAVALGASQMARERGARTLDFLLVRPVSPATILWTKFLAGSVALALLVAAAAALCFINPDFHDDREIGLLALRQSIRFTQLAAVLLPRAWCVYALAFGFSVMVNHVAKAVVALAVAVLALAGLASVYSDLFPFADLELWTPFVEPFSLTLRLARDPALFRISVFTLSGAALALAFLATLLFRRSPGRSLGNRQLLLGAAALVAVAILSTRAEDNRFPVVAPAASLELQMNSKRDLVNMEASGKLLIVAAEDSLAFLDFSDAHNPRKIVEAPMPLWTTRDLAVSGVDAYMLGTRKALPVDELQIAIATLTPAGAVHFAEPIPLGLVDTAGYPASLAVAGHFLYLDTIRERQCRIEIYDVSPAATRRDAGAVIVETLPAHLPGTTDRTLKSANMRMALRGGFLYVTTPAALTAIDVRDPAAPVVSARTEFHAALPVLWAFPRALASDGGQLLEAEPWPSVWNVFDLADPAHPARRGSLANHRGIVNEPAPVFLQHWKGGLLEFRQVRGSFQALRYLHDGRRGDAGMVAATGDYVYSLKGTEDGQFVSQFAGATMKTSQ
jgi:ABC-type transport system involved in multi-copper enzyme maturation permease subunit